MRVVRAQSFFPRTCAGATITHNSPLILTLRRRILLVTLRYLRLLVMSSCSTKTRAAGRSWVGAAQQLVEKHVDEVKKNVTREAEGRRGLDSSALACDVATLIGAANLTKGTTPMVEALNHAFTSLSKSVATVTELVGNFSGFETRFSELVDSRSDFAKSVARMLGAARWCCMANVAFLDGGVDEEINNTFVSAKNLAATMAASEPAFRRLSKGIIATIERLHGVLEGDDSTFNSSVGGGATTLVAAVAFVDAVGTLAGIADFRDAVQRASGLRQSAVNIADCELTEIKENAACINTFLALANSRHGSATAPEAGNIYGDDPYVDPQDAPSEKQPNHCSNKNSDAQSCEEDGRKAFAHMAWLKSAVSAYTSWRPEASGGDLQRVFFDEPLKLFKDLRDTLETVRFATLAGLDDEKVTHDDVSCPLV
jgi:hypothetical protein